MVNISAPVAKSIELDGSLEIRPEKQEIDTTADKTFADLDQRRESLRKCVKIVLALSDEEAAVINFDASLSTLGINDEPFLRNFAVGVRKLLQTVLYEQVTRDKYVYPQLTALAGSKMEPGRIISTDTIMNSITLNDILNLPVVEVDTTK